MNDRELFEECARRALRGDYVTDVRTGEEVLFIRRADGRSIGVSVAVLARLSVTEFAKACDEADRLFGPAPWPPVEIQGKRYEFSSVELKPA